MKKDKNLHAVTNREKEIHNKRFEEAVEILQEDNKDAYVKLFEKILKPNMKYIFGSSQEFLQKQASKLSKEDKIKQIAKCMVSCNNFAHFYEKSDVEISSDFFNLKGTLLYDLMKELDKDDRKRYPYWGFDDDGRFFTEIQGYGQINVHINKLNINESYKRKNVFRNKRVMIPAAVSLELLEDTQGFLKNCNKECVEYNESIKRGDWIDIAKRNMRQYTYNDSPLKGMLCTVSGRVEKYDDTKHTVQQGKNLCIINVLENEGKSSINIFGVDSYINRKGEIDLQHSIEIEGKEKPDVVTMNKVIQSLLKLPDINKEEIEKKSKEDLLKILASKVKKDKQYVVPVSCHIKKNAENRKENRDDYTYVGGNTGELRIALVTGKNENVEYKDFDLEFQQPKVIDNKKNLTKEIIRRDAIKQGEQVVGLDR